jgi:hypothetical protein
MGKLYKRDIVKEYFRSLKSFRYNPFFHPSIANNRQLVLAKNLHRSYGIPEGNILRLIMYTDIALSYPTNSEIQVYYSDLSEIADFEKNPIPIEKVVFRGDAKAFEITNPYLTDKLYNSLLELIDFQKITQVKHAKKKLTSAKIIKKVARELFNELTQVEKISNWRSLSIIGYIFCLYNIGLKSEEPILSEDKFNLLQKGKQVVTETYLQYLASRIERYIN